jgi:hypothetical protein
MTRMELGVEGLRLALTLGAALFVYAVFWRNSRRDAYCQDLFRLRDELWDYAADRGLLDSDAHRRLRDLANSLIRTAPVAHLFVVLPAFLLIRLPKGSPPTRQVIENMPDPGDRRVFEKLQDRMTYRLTRHLLLGSVCGFVLLTCIVLAAAIALPVIWAGRLLGRVWATKLRKRWQSIKLNAAYRIEVGAHELERYESVRKCVSPKDRKLTPVG